METCFRCDNCSQVHAQQAAKLLTCCFTLSCDTCLADTCKACDTATSQHVTLLTAKTYPVLAALVDATEDSRHLMCDRCDEEPVQVDCRECRTSLCCPCSDLIHGKGAYRAHTLSQRRQQ